MENNSSAIIALVIIIIFVIIVVVALSWHPAPALSEKEECTDAKDLLKLKQDRRNSPSALASPRDSVLSPVSVSAETDAWDVIRRLKENQSKTD